VLLEVGVAAVAVALVAGRRRHAVAGTRPYAIGRR
jgi:hypothetical protein